MDRAGSEHRRLERATRLLVEAGARLAILFGSRARGEAREGSDWDIAVLGIEGEREGLTSRLRAVLGGRVDLVDLQHAPPVLCDRVMREGRVLVDDDGSRFARFASLTLRRHDDNAKLRRAQVESLRRFGELHAGASRARS